MASELVPGNFSLVEINASFRWFSPGHKRGLEPPANYSFIKKKKKTNNINSRKK